MTGFFQLQRLDARVKLLLLLGVSTTSLFFTSCLKLTAIFLFILFLLLAGGIPPRQIWRQTRVMLRFILVLFLIQCIFLRSGSPLLTLGDFVLVTNEGLKTAVQVTLRFLIILNSALITLSGTVRDYLLALQWFRLPYELAYMTLAALRFLPLLREEAVAVMTAMQMRGVNFAEVTLKQKAKYYLALLLPVTAGALYRAEQMSISMEARGFRSRPQRTNWRQLHFCMRDLFYFLFACFILCLILFLL